MMHNIWKQQLSWQKKTSNNIERPMSLANDRRPMLIANDKMHEMIDVVDKTTNVDSKWQNDRYCSASK